MLDVSASFTSRESRYAAERFVHGPANFGRYAVGMQERPKLYENVEALFLAAGFMWVIAWLQLPPKVHSLTKVDAVVTEVKNLSKTGVRLAYRDTAGNMGGAVVRYRQSLSKEALRALNGRSVVMLLSPGFISADATVYGLTLDGKTLLDFEYAAARDRSSAKTMAFGATVMSAVGMWALLRRRRRGPTALHVA